MPFFSICRLFFSILPSILLLVFLPPLSCFTLLFYFAVCFLLVWLRRGSLHYLSNFRLLFIPFLLSFSFLTLLFFFSSLVLFLTSASLCPTSFWPFPFFIMPFFSICR